MSQTVLLVGGCGYIGSVLAEEMAREGWRVRCLDAMIYGGDPVQYMASGAEIIKADARDPDEVGRAMDGCDTVVHLCGLVGEPACSLAGELALEVNLGSVLVAAEAAQSAGVRQFVFLSTCSVYGAQAGELTEDSELTPVSLYAWTKAAAERELVRRYSDSLAVTILRLATVYGLSPRPRLDSVINRMTSDATVEGRIQVLSAGQRRPVVHVKDVASTILACASQDLGKSPHILNVGSNRQNYTIRDIAREVASCLPSVEIEETLRREDTRDYSVRFDRLTDAAGRGPRYEIRDGVLEINRAIASGRISDVGSDRFNNLLGLKAALDVGAVRTTHRPDLWRSLMQLQDANLTSKSGIEGDE